MSQEQQYEFSEREHLAGHHNTYTEGCSECYKKNRLIKAKIVCISKNYAGGVLSVFGMLLIIILLK